MNRGVKMPEVLSIDNFLKGCSQQQKKISYFALFFLSVDMQQSQAFLSIIFPLLQMVNTNKSTLVIQRKQWHQLQPNMHNEQTQITKHIKTGFSSVASICISASFIAVHALSGVFMFGLTLLLWWCDMAERSPTWWSYHQRTGWLQSTQPSGSSTALQGAAL